MVNFTNGEQEFEQPWENDLQEVLLIFLDVQKNRVVNAVEYVHVPHYLLDFLDNGRHIVVILGELVLQKILVIVYACSIF